MIIREANEANESRAINPHNREEYEWALTMRNFRPSNLNLPGKFKAPRGFENLDFATKYLPFLIVTLKESIESLNQQDKYKILLRYFSIPLY